MIVVIYSFNIGSCSIFPKEGVILVDEFTLRCQGWNDKHAPLRYRFYGKRDGVISEIHDGFVPSSMTGLSLRSNVAGGEEEVQFVYFDIIDRLGGRTTVNDTVLVSKAQN